MNHRQNTRPRGDPKNFEPLRTPASPQHWRGLPPGEGVKKKRQV